jgi:cation transport ATPase
MEGESHADEAVITGESRPVPKGVGSPVIAGSINMDGPLLIRSTRTGTDTRWAQICRSVRDALTQRSPTQRLADRIVGIFVPLVLSLGVLRLRPRSASGGWRGEVAWSASLARSKNLRARACLLSTRRARSRQAERML